MTEGPLMISDMDENATYEPPSLVKNSGDTHVALTWNHADCIASYKIEICPKIDPENNCQVKNLSPDATTDKTVHYRVENLDTCKEYELKIMPVINRGEEKTLQTTMTEFMTTDGMPQAPTEFKVVTNDDSTASEVSWTEAKCATSYKIFHKKMVGGIEGEEQEIITKTSSESFDGLEPCETYYYSVATMVGDQMSPRTEWHNVAVPPNQEEEPKMQIVSKENGNMTLKLDPPSDNSQCTIAEYELKYSTDGGITFTVVKPTGSEVAGGADSKDFRIPSNENTQIRARLRYASSAMGTAEAWSKPLVHGPEQPFIDGPASGMLLDTTSLIPIVVGVAVLLVVVIVVAVLIMRRKKSRMLDAEKNGAGSGGHENGNKKSNGAGTSHAVMAGSEEETQKLNANHDNPDNFA